MKNFEIIVAVYMYYIENTADMSPPPEKVLSDEKILNHRWSKIHSLWLLFAWGCGVCYFKLGEWLLMNLVCKPESSDRKLSLSKKSQGSSLSIFWKNGEEKNFEIILAVCLYYIECIAHIFPLLWMYTVQWRENLELQSK